MQNSNIPTETHSKFPYIYMNIQKCDNIATLARFLI